MAKKKTKTKKKTEDKANSVKEKAKVKKDKKTTKKKKKSNPDCKWYVLNIQTGREKTAAKALKQRAEATGLEDVIEEVLVPVQKKIVIKKGEQEIEEENIFPGYVLVKMVLDEKTWTIVKSTEGIRGFVKTEKRPRPLPDKEVKAIMKFMEVEQPAYKAAFNVGEAVKIIDGAFADFIGSVENIDEEKGKVSIMISFLGREAPVEVDFSQVSKL